MLENREILLKNPRCSALRGVSGGLTAQGARWTNTRREGEVDFFRSHAQLEGRRMRRFPIVAIAFVAGISVLGAQAWAQMPMPPDAREVLSDDYEGTSYSPYAARELGDGEAPSRLLWGDTHLHTAMSMDAGAFGNRLGIDGGLPLRARRGDRLVDRDARAALPAPGLPGGGRPFRQHGLLPRSLRREAEHPGGSDRQGLVRADPGRGRGRAWRWS